MSFNKRILVIEDDPYIAGLLQTFLEDEGFVVLTLNTAVKALDLLHNQCFDLITLDLGLPEMDGNQFLQELKKKKSSIPVVVISANTNRLIKTELVKSVIPKPFDLERLSEVIHHVS